MKTALAFAFLVVAVWRMDAATAASPKVPADVHLLATGTGPSSMMMRAVGRNDLVCANRTKSCADCNRVNVCAYVGSGYTYLYSSQCPDSAPYCVEGECVQRADECQLPAVANDFTCFEGDDFQGYYPSPTDCTKYYVCANTVAYVYNCPAEHIYSHARAGCVRRDQSPDSCYTFDCNAYPQYLLYKPDQAIYAVCARPGYTLVSKCRPNYRIDPAKPNEPCRPYCARQGRIADEDNPRAYYECNLLASGQQQGASCTNCAAPGTLSDPVKEYCPPDMVYSPISQRCVLALAPQPVPTPSPAPLP